MPYLGAKPTDVFADQDLNGAEFILDADADTSITADTDDQIDIRIAGADDFQFTANTFTAQSGSTIAAQALTATTVNASGVVGVISAHDLGTGLHIKTADSSLSAIDANADELIIEGSAHSGLSILSGNTSQGAILFGDAQDADIGEIRYDHNTNDMVFHGNAQDIMTLNEGAGGGSGVAYIGDSANTFMSGGITLNQGGIDGSIFGLKSSDIAHPFTALAEADTYVQLTKVGGAVGGLTFKAFSESNVAFNITGFVATESTSDTTSSPANVQLRGYTTDGSTSHDDMGATANLVNIMNRNTTHVLFKGNGTIHASDTSWATSLDEEDDMLALRMLDKAQSTSGIIDSAWDSMIGTDWEYLQKIGVAGSNHPEKGHPDMFSIQGVQKLTMGATWYLGQNFMAFLETVEKHMPGIRKEYEEHMLAQSGRPAMLTQAAN